MYGGVGAVIKKSKKQIWRITPSTVDTHFGVRTVVIRIPPKDRAGKSFTIFASSNPCKACPCKHVDTHPGK